MHPDPRHRVTFTRAQPIHLTRHLRILRAQAIHILAHTAKRADGLPQQLLPVGKRLDRRAEPLGSDYGLAIKRWAEIEHASADKPRQVITFRYVAERYMAEVLPTNAPGTQRVNLCEMKKLLEFFDDPPCPLDDIEPQHVKQYMRWRNIVGANRERALLSHVWNWAREEGYTAAPNPCAGVKGKRSKGRNDVYIEDELLLQVWSVADAPLQDALDLFYLTGQRVADTLKMDERHIREQALHVQQNKTGAKRRIEVTPALQGVLDRIRARKARLVIHSTRLVVDIDGQPMTYAKLRGAFDRARAAVGIPKKDFQMRDLRAKAGTDKTDSAGDIRQAQKQLGHANVAMTEHYVRNRRGAKVTPTK
jgi:integrase